MTMKKKAYIFLLLAFCVRFAAFSQTDSLQVNLMEVVVTGTGTPHLLQDAPVQTEVITGKMLRNYAGKSIEDILGGLTASFAFNQDDMGSQMQLNGLGNSYILILIDGKRIHGDVGGQNELSLIDPQNIEKIEIVKGASSALYGSDAIAGVINIITKKHRDEGVLVENTTRVGSYGDVRQHNGLSLRYGKVSSYTNFQLQHSDGWQNTAVEHTLPTEDPITDSRNKTVNRHTNWQVSERITYQPLSNWELYGEGSTYWKRIYRVSGRHPHYDVKTWDMEYHNASASIGGKWQRSKTDYIKKSSKWTTDFDDMAKKTVIKLNLSRNAPLSVEMQDAIKADQSVMYEADKYEYADNMEQQIIDAQKAQEVADKFADFDDVTNKKEDK